MGFALRLIQAKFGRSGIGFILGYFLNNKFNI